MSFLDRAHDLLPDLIELRRDIHQRPELGFEENETALQIEEALERYVPRALLQRAAKTGLVASLPADGPSVVLRACIDALPIQDAKHVDYASKVPDKSHACGHDAQIAALVGALILLEGSDVPVKVHGVFQPAEEIDEGARALLDEGVIERLNPDVIFGFHGHPSLDAGVIGVKPGPIMASITTLRCRIAGREGHGAEPHLAVDAATAGASLILDWQIALARRIDPREGVVLSVGRISSGVTPNVIPGRAEVDATLRVLNPEVQQHVLQVLRQVVSATETKTGTSIEMSAELVVPAVVNHINATEIVAQATRDLLGPGSLSEAKPSLGGDDFAWYLQDRKGCYFFVGERKQGVEPYGWHDPSYDIDEASLLYASATLAQVVGTVANRDQR